jgi:hypothetical protein
LLRAEKAHAASDQAGRAGVPRRPIQGRLLHQAWAKAEQAFDRWTAQEATDRWLPSALPLITPEGRLNTRARAEAEVRAALAGQTADDWGWARRLLTPEAYTFLDRVQEQLAAPAGGGGVAARGRGRGATPAAARGALLTAGVTLALAQEAGAQALTLVRQVLDRAWRSSSSVEGVNSVVQMHQRRQKRLPQELLDLQLLHWNLHEFRVGKRRKSCPYARLGLVLPAGRSWALLQRTPEQLAEELSALNPTA